MKEMKVMPKEFIVDHAQNAYEDLKKILLYCCETVINFEEVLNHTWYDINPEDVKAFKERYTFKDEMDLLNKMDQYWFKRNSIMKGMIHAFQNYQVEGLSFQIPPVWFGSVFQSKGRIECIAL